jgi:FkbM family methyltransferase
VLTIFPEIAQNGIDLVDVGCSGDLDPRWRDLVPILNYVGFDPNVEECKRLSEISLPCKTVKYVPCAVAGHVGEGNIYLTESPYCSSMLKPHQEWLKRFSYKDLFKVVGSETVRCDTLENLAETDNLRADVIKLDTQGMELPILKAAGRVLQDAFCVVTETGLVECYNGESVAADVDKFMRANGFMLFDQEIHRVDRGNEFGESSDGQPMWCESLWLRDHLSKESWGIDAPTLDRAQALKALYLCNYLGFPDYGFELVAQFNAQGLLSKEDVQQLSKSNTWIPKAKRGSQGGLIEKMFRLLPLCVRQGLFESLKVAVKRPHLLKGLIRGQKNGGE